MDYEQSNEVFEISQDELNALLTMYYNILYTLKHGKGLLYMQSFQFKKSVDKLILDNKRSNCDINEFIRVKVNDDVN